MKFLLEYNKFIPKYRPTINFISPSEDRKTYDSFISVEAIVKWADDGQIWLKLNGEFVSKLNYKVKNGKLFAEKIKLEPGENILKVVAKNEAGTIDYSRKIFYDEIGATYTDDENKIVMNTISDIIKEYYSHIDPFKSNRIVDEKGVILNTEYLSKWVNNRTFRMAIIRDFGLSNDYRELLDFLEENKFDIFNIKGKYFDKYYRIMEITTLKGKDTEDRSLKVFGDYTIELGKGTQIEFAKPTTEEDKKGIDAFAIINKKRKVTIQVKPLARIKSRTSDYIELVSAGDVRKIKTDILIVANDKSYFIIKVPLNEIDPLYLQTEKSDDETLDEIKLPNFETRDADKVIRFSTKQLLLEKNLNI